MTDHDSAGTAAELDAITARAEHMGLGLAKYPVWEVREMIRANASLRKQLDEARGWIAAQDVDMKRLAFERDEARAENAKAQERYAVSQSVAGDMASALDDARADNAKKDAALREAVIEECAKFVIDWMDDAGFPQEDIEALNAAMRALVGGAHD